MCAYIYGFELCAYEYDNVWLWLWICIIKVDVPTRTTPAGAGMSPDKANIMEEISKLAKASGASKKTERKKMTVADARAVLEDAQGELLLEGMDLVKEAIKAVEETGIVFIDEIDKLVNHGDYRGADASSEGVQRDLLPMIEGI